MQSLTVELGDRSYPIQIGPGLLRDASAVLPYLKTPRVAIVTNATVGPLYLWPLADQLRALGVAVTPVVLPDGEIHKNWETLNLIFNAMLADRCERSTTVVALGGGVVGDMAGFAAACYQRGVPFIQIPTTLLSQVDSSVGGKTGINHPAGKNMIGAFYQPRLVLADTDTLNTLPDRELSAGLAEVIKYGLIRDLPFLEWLEANMASLLARDPDALAYAIQRSCACKAGIVAADERESGERALLNLGHTFGHAIETATGYVEWLHGEAVGAGMLMAADLSARLGWILDADVARTRRVIEQARLPVVAPALGAARYLDLMALDKKVEAGKLRLVLLRGLGKACVESGVPAELIRATLEGPCVGA